MENDTEIDEAVYHAVLKEIKEMEKERNESIKEEPQEKEARI